MVRRFRSAFRVPHSFAPTGGPPSRPGFHAPDSPPPLPICASQSHIAPNSGSPDRVVAPPPTSRSPLSSRSPRHADSLSRSIASLPSSRLPSPLHGVPRPASTPPSSSWPSLAPAPHGRRRRPWPPPPGCRPRLRMPVPLPHGRSPLILAVPASRRPCPRRRPPRRSHLLFVSYPLEFHCFFCTSQFVPAVVPVDTVS